MQEIHLNRSYIYKKNGDNKDMTKMKPRPLGKKCKNTNWS